MMTLRDKVAHAYRRFGFGATPAELDEGVKIGLEKVLVKLIDFDRRPDDFNMHPFEFAFRDKEEADPGAYRMRLWWALRMMCTNRPLEEKLALFWHNHFAVSDNKVEDGLMMVDYLQELRQHGSGRFLDLLTAISKNPAMMKYLDMNRSMRGHPNENFAREVMELFTLGIGNYTEADVQAASRAFTGWGYIHFYWETPGKHDDRLNEALKYIRPYSAFTLMPALHDPSEKTFMGTTGALDGDAVLKRLAEHPITVKRLITRLWTFFGYDNPDAKLVDRLSTVYQKSNGDIRTVVWAIAKSPEFWSDKSVRQRVKCPAEFCIGIARQMGIGEALMARRRKEATPNTPAPKVMIDSLWYLCDRMEKCGMNLLYPPDVSGWRWGTAWITPATMVERYAFRGMMLWDEKGMGPGAQCTKDFVLSRKPTTTRDIAKALAELFDIPISNDRVDVVAAAVERHGGINALKGDWAGALHDGIHVLIAAPEAHFC